MQVMVELKIMVLNIVVTFQLKYLLDKTDKLTPFRRWKLTP